MIEILVSVKDGVISGATSNDSESIMSLDGGEYVCRLTTPRGRSLSQLGLYWAVCGMIADNFDAGGHELTKDHVDHILRVGAGHSTAICLADGRYQFVPKSIAFNKLQQPEFNEIMDKALTIAANKFGPALADAARKELAKMIAGDPKNKDNDKS